jgi:hypothetical protein
MKTCIYKIRVTLLTLAVPISIICNYNRFNLPVPLLDLFNSNVRTLLLCQTKFRVSDIICTSGFNITLVC